jgi:hypothetical protein
MIETANESNQPSTDTCRIYFGLKQSKQYEFRPMTDVHKALSSIDDITPAPSNLQSIADWLDAPMPLNAADDLPPIQRHLATLRANCTDRQLHFATLDRLYTRCISVVSNLRPSLVGTSLPISRRTRQLIRNLQDLLRSLADEYESTLARFAASPSSEQKTVQEGILGRILFALAQHLFTSNLVAAQSGNGIWQQLHKTYETARRLDIVRNTRDDTPSHRPVGMRTTGIVHRRRSKFRCCLPGAFCRPG